jgi:hypothetical protein
MIAYGDALWDELRLELDERLTEALGPGTDWTGHDVYAHLARWQEISIASLRKLMAGEAPEPAEADDDTLNNRGHDEDRTLPVAATRERCIATHEHLRSLLLGLSEDEWREFGVFFDDATGPHFEHHLAMIGERVTR